MKQLSVFLLFLSATALCSASTLRFKRQATASATCPAYHGVNLQRFHSKWWKDVVNITSWAECNSLCTEISKCEKWTWHNQHAGKWKFYCRLMEKPTTINWTINQSVVSGTKCDAEMQDLWKGYLQGIL